MEPFDEGRGSLEVRTVEIASHGRLLSARLQIPRSPRGLILFADGSGSDPKRDRTIAGALHRTGFCTLLPELITANDEAVEHWTRDHRFDIQLLATRLVSARRWVSIDDSVGGLPLGYFGSGIGAAAAMVAAAYEPDNIWAIVSCAGRPDLAADALPLVSTPTLLIIGGGDREAGELNEQAYRNLLCEKALRIIPGASRHFEEPGALEDAGRMAAEWFGRYLRQEQPAAQP